MLCESLRVGDVVFVPFLETYASVQHVNGLLVRLMTLARESVLTDRRNVKFINRSNQKGLFDMAQEETVISIRIEGGYIKKGAVVVSKGDLAAVNTFQTDGDVDWNAIISNALGEIAAAEIVPLPDVQFVDAPTKAETVTGTEETPAKPAKKKKEQAATPEPASKPELAKPRVATKLEPLTTVPKQTKSLFDF